MLDRFGGKSWGFFEGIEVTLPESEVIWQFKPMSAWAPGYHAGENLIMEQCVKKMA